MYSRKLNGVLGQQRWKLFELLRDLPAGTRPWRKTLLQRLLSCTNTGEHPAKNREPRGADILKVVSRRWRRERRGRSGGVEDADPEEIFEALFVDQGA